MLMQSHYRSDGGEIDLLPALPDAWHSGSAKGLRGRGGFVLAQMTWKQGELLAAEILSEKGGKLTVRCGGESWIFDTKPGEILTVEPGGRDGN